jgi:ketosteroid isomerase-like protein
MKRTFIWALVGLVLLMNATCIQAQKSMDTEKAIAALEQQWLDTQKANKPELVAPLLADKYVVTDESGKVYDKAGFIALQKTFKWTSVENTDVKVTAYGDTAIAIGLWKGKGTDASGKPFESAERWTDAWVKMPSGKWQCVATQLTAAKP